MRTVQIAKYGSDGSLIGTGSGVHFSPGGGITAPVLLVLLAVTTLAMYGLILANARRFGAAPDRIAALKLLAYASTPALLGALLSFVPFIGFLFALAGIVGTVMLFRSGAPLLLPPVPGEEVRFGRTIAVRAAMLALALPIVFVLVVFLVGTLVLGPLRP